jgi:hypothetical protein
MNQTLLAGDIEYAAQYPRVMLQPSTYRFFA